MMVASTLSRGERYCSQVQVHVDRRRRVEGLELPQRVIEQVRYLQNCFAEAKTSEESLIMTTKSILAFTPLPIVTLPPFPPTKTPARERYRNESVHLLFENLKTYLDLRNSIVSARRLTVNDP